MRRRGPLALLPPGGQNSGVAVPYFNFYFGLDFNFAVKNSTLKFWTSTLKFCSDASAAPWLWGRCGGGGVLPPGRQNSGVAVPYFNFYLGLDFNFDVKSSTLKF